MIDVQKPVRAGYIATLENMIGVDRNGSSYFVPIYDRVPARTPYPYIVIAQQTQSGQSVKYPSTRGCRTFESTILLNVHTAFMGDEGGKEQADTIAEKIIELVLPYDEISGKELVGVDVGIDYQDKLHIFDLELEDTFGGEQITETETDYSIRRSIRFRNYIQKI